MLPFLIGAALALEPSEGFQVDQWTISDGLPLNHVTDLAFTDDGLLWISSFDGVVTFDGLSFQEAPEAVMDALGTSRVVELTVHPADGALWLSGESRSLVRTDGQRIDAYDRHGDFGRHPLAAHIEGDEMWILTDDGLFQATDRLIPWREDLVSGLIIGLTTGPEGERLLGFPDRILRVFPDGHAEPLDLPPGLPDVLYSMEGLQDGGLWVLGDRSTTAGVWDGTDWTLTTAQIGAPPTCSRRPWATPLPCTPEGGEGSPWQVSREAVYHSGRRILTLSAPIAVGQVDADGDLWLATQGEGLLRVRREMLEVVRSGEADERVDMVLVDDADQLWLRKPGQGWWWPGSDGPIWLTHDGEPLLPRYIFQLPGEPPTLVEQEELIALSGTDGQFQGLTIAAGPIEQGAAVATDAQGDIWLAALYGVLRRDSRGWRPVLLDDAPITDSHAIAALPDGAVVLASRRQGLLHIDGDRIEPIVGQDRPGTLNIRHLRLADGWLWASTEDAGLCALGPVAASRASWRWRCIGRGTGLPGRGAHISIDDGAGNTWVSTNHGLGVTRSDTLAAFARGERDRVDLLRLGEADGMVNSEANGGSDRATAMSGAGRLWFATQVGAVGVDTVSFSLPRPPDVVFTGAVLETEALPLDEIVLPARSAPLDLIWSAPIRRYAEQVRFRSRINGGPWGTPSDRRTLQLAHLPARHFTVEVQAGIAGAWGAIVAIHGYRTPQLWERQEAWAGLFVLLSASLVLLVWRRLALARVREERLEALVATRTGALQVAMKDLEVQRDQNAAQARKLAGLDELKTRMLVNLHHELRTPLSLVLAPIRGIVSTHPSSELDLALRNAEHLEHLVEQLTDIAHLQSGTVQMQARRLDLAAFARRCAERFLPLARDRAITLTVEDADPCLAWLDGELMEKALGNLVHNALKFTPTGGLVSVSLEVDGEHVRVQVADTGPGVPPNERDRIFERLYQIDRGDNREHGGSGLGLALAREVIELHGGNIGCLSRAGGGSVFWLRMPRGTAHLTIDDISTAAPVPSQSPPLPTDSEGEGPLVLVVEDHPDMRAFIASSLREGCRVITAADGSEGLKKARQERPAVIVSDVMMPKIDGLVMARELRSDPALQQIPIVLVSAKTRSDSRVEGLSVADAWLNKPFHVPELRAIVRRLLDRPAPPTPEEPEAAQVPEADGILLRKLEEALAPRLDNPDLGIAILARAVGMSERTLQRELGRILGISPSTWVREQRLHAAEQLLASGRYRTVGEVAAAVGMSRSYFSRAYRAWCGRTPSDDLP